MNKKNEHRPQIVKKHPSATAKNAELNQWKYSVALFIILVISFIAFLPVLRNGFIWDDNSYIVNNRLIHSINLKEIFSNKVGGNYFPFTMMTYAAIYHFFGLNAAGYHAVNLLLHLLNTLLVFYAIFLLSKNTVVALITSLLFGIHPLHVESVAWAAQLKDVLYAFFFLASYIFYLKYLKDLQKKYYVFALLMFLFSLLSKAMAVSLLLIMVLTDYFKGRKINAKTLLEKAPFFLLALAFGVTAVVVQKSSGAIHVTDIFTFPQHLVFACYGFITYLFRLSLPLNLCAYYPYPEKIDNSIPSEYYAYVFLFAVIAFCVLYSLRFSKLILFGIAFFAITVIFVLQILPVGGAIMADRYSYIPSIGIFYLAGEGFNYLLYNKKFKLFSIALLTIVSIFFLDTTYNRSKIWNNSMTFWNDMIGKYNTIPESYYSRGIVFMDEKRNEEALNDFNKAIELKQNYIQAYINRGIIFLNEKRNDEALNDFNKAIELDNSFPKAYLNRGIIFYNEKKYEEAINDYSKTITLQPDYADAYYNRGLAEYYSGKKDAACLDIRKASGLGYQTPVAALQQICK